MDSQILMEDLGECAISSRSLASTLNCILLWGFHLDQLMSSYGVKQADIFYGTALGVRYALYEFTLMFRCPRVRLG